MSTKISSNPADCQEQLISQERNIRFEFSSIFEISCLIAVLAQGVSQRIICICINAGGGQLIKKLKNSHIDGSDFARGVMTTNRRERDNSYWDAGIIWG
jgi:hypothetical protein